MAGMSRWRAAECTLRFIHGVQDPGNLESDLQAGAQGGYTLCWVLLWSTVVVSTVCSACRSQSTLHCFVLLCQLAFVLLPA